MEERPSAQQRDRRVLEIQEQLLEIEQRLIPTGLHVFGRPAEQSEIAALLGMVASFDRPELRIRALPDLIAEALGLPPYAALLEQSRADRERFEQRERVEVIAGEAVAHFVEREGDASVEASVAFLRARAGVAEDAARPIFQLLRDLCERLATSGELDGLARALRGRYVAPGPGADLIQNPFILPTGRNTHAVNPYVVPSPGAVRRARPLAEALLDRHLRETGRHPETVAMVLWGIDNIKTEGEAVAQALWLLGVRPTRDAMNRATDVEIVPLEELGRPRIDVVMTVSGIFRDLFGATMGLLDRAVRRVASLDEPPARNFVRAHVERQVAEEGCPFDEAATRVFSNAAGNYGTNVNFMVLESQWEDRRELGELFVTRKCFAYGRDGEGRAFDGREARRLMEKALSRVEVTYQNIDTVEVGLTDVDHYFEYLGGVTRAVENQTGARPRVYLSDSLSPAARIRTLEEALRLETRTKALNPKWFEGMLRHGFSGVAEIEHQVTNTFGWSATADAVDDWMYEAVAETYVLDEAMLARLRSLNPHSTRTLVGRLLEAAGRGFWQADQPALDRLRDAFSSLEDELEGVAP